MKPYAGDALVSALFGYDDSLWAVRNSSTMVYSSIMLRVIDADKNATRTDTTSSKVRLNNALFHN